MRVIYDIDLLGRIHLNPSQKAGVLRVVENVVNGLSIRNECELYLQSSIAPVDPKSIEEIVACFDYVESSPHLLKTTFIEPDLKRQLFKEIIYLDQKIGETSGFERLLCKVARKALLYSQGFIQNATTRMEAKELGKADIYHSPSSPIPAQIRRVKKLKKFLTMYDLNTILFPQFFNQGNIDYHRKIHSSIHPEDWIICISHATKNDVCDLLSSVNPRQVLVTHLAASSETFYQCTDSEKIANTLQKYKIPNAPYILSLCTLEPRKNIDHVIRCFAQMVQEQGISDLYLVLVGGKGWIYEKIFEELAKYDLAKDHVIITGYVADEDLAALYSGALAFTYLSLYEGFGLPPLEAMQCGIPVITSNNSSLPEVVGDAAIMLDAHDTDGLCQNMLELYNNASLRSEMSLKSLERAKLFSWEKCIDQTIAAYQTALES